jgi:Peptidase M50B-like
MKFQVAQDARPQVQLLLLAAAISFALWFIPFAGWLVYPFQLFVTFIHEGSHVIAALLTGASVQSLSVAPDGSGMVMSASSSTLSQMIVSSAGYVGAVSFGALLLYLIRLGVRPNIVLFFCSILVGVLTIVFGFLAPALNIFSGNSSILSIGFTVLAGAFITAMLFFAASFLKGWWANFLLSFLAVQCLLGAFFNIRDLFLVSSMTPYAHSDATNMAQATGIPSILWVLIWLGISVLVMSLSLRVYSYSRVAKVSADPVFDASNI